LLRPPAGSKVNKSSVLLKFAINPHDKAVVPWKVTQTRFEPIKKGSSELSNKQVLLEGLISLDLYQETSLPREFYQWKKRNHLNIHYQNFS